MLVQPGYTSNKCRRDLRILSNGRARLASGEKEAWREKLPRRRLPAGAMRIDTQIRRL